MKINIIENFFIKNVNSDCVNIRIYWYFVSIMIWRIIVYFLRVFFLELNKILECVCKCVFMMKCNKNYCIVYVSIMLVFLCLKIL